MIVYVQTSDYEATSNDPEALRSEILGLTLVLQVLRCQLGEPVPYVLPKKHRTIDDILVHITNLLNTSLRSKLVVAVSGSPSSIMDLTLTVVMQDESYSNPIRETHGTSISPSPHLFCICDERYVY